MGSLHLKYSWNSFSDDDDAFAVHGVVRVLVINCIIVFYFVFGPVSEFVFSFFHSDVGLGGGCALVVIFYIWLGRCPVAIFPSWNDKNLCDEESAAK